MDVPLFGARAPASGEPYEGILLHIDGQNYHIDTRRHFTACILSLVGCDREPCGCLTSAGRVQFPETLVYRGANLVWIFVTDGGEIVLCALTEAHKRAREAADPKADR